VRSNRIAAWSWLAVAPALILSACADDSRPGGPPAQYLTRAGDCQTAERYVRAAAIASMNAQLEDSLARALRRECWGEDDGPWPGGPPPPPATPPSEGGAGEYSTTNNQVAGVDEADFVKNDANYIYVVSGQHFRIIDAWPAAEAHELARVAIEGVPTRLFVDGDRALVYSSLPIEGDGGGTWGGGCTYGYYCDFTGDGHPTKLTIFDIADRAHPVLVREIESSGSFLAARRIQDAVHTVLSQPALQVPGVQYWPDGLDTCSTDTTDADIRLAFEVLRLANLERINRATSFLLPTVTDRVHRPDGTVTNDVHRACDLYEAPEGDAFTTVLSVDLPSSDELGMATILSRPGAVYSSAQTLYMAVTDADPYVYDSPPEEEKSHVHAFALSGDPPGAVYAGTGVVKGRVLNQFSMDEHEGYLRLATTTGHVPDPAVHSTLTVLAGDGHDLTAVGVLDHLAPGEDIRSVRFAGDRGFVVTFKKTDPLFVFDLSEPAHPAVLGELKIPGFSTYMHLLGDDARHLLAIGYDAADHGDFAFFTGVLLQIFDISDPAHPALTHREVIGTRGSSSAALTDHLAFNYFAPRDLLALPMTICEGGDTEGGYGDTMTFSGLLVYDVTIAGGFHPRGRVAHPPGEEISCGNWWTDARSQVERSVIMDDFVFSISRALIKVNALGDLTTDLAALPIAE